MKFQGRLTDEAGREFDLLFVLEPAVIPPPPPPPPGELTLSLSNDQTIQVGQTARIEFPASGGVPPYVYTINWKDGSSVEGVVATFAYHIFEESDLYLVEVTVQDAAGAEVTDTIRVEVTALPEPDPDPPPPDGAPDLPGVVLAHAEKVTLAAGERHELPLSRKHHPYLSGSLLVRFKADALAESVQTVVAGAHGSALQMPAFSVGVAADGRPFGSGSLQLKSNAIRLQEAVGSTVVNVGVWYTVCVVWDPYVKKVYVDGSLEGVFYTDDTVQQITDEDYYQAYTGKPDTLPDDAPMPVVLGRHEWFNDTQGASFAGIVSHVLLSDKVWDGLQVLDAHHWATANQPSEPLRIDLPDVPITFWGGTVTFPLKIAGGTPPYTGLWGYGDGTFGDDLYFHTYPANGTYTAILTVTDAAGATATRSVQVMVEGVTPPPPEPLAVTATPTVTGLNVAWDVQISGGTPPYNQVWLYGDGTSGTEPSHDYHHPNEYHVQLTVTDAVGAQVVLISVVTPHGDPTPDPKPTPVSGYFTTHHNEFVRNFGEHPTLQSVRSGPASDPAVWDHNRLPRDGDVVAVNAGHEVLYDLFSDARLDTLAVRPSGRLDWTTDIPTRLRTSQLLIEERAVAWLGTTNRAKGEVLFNDRPLDLTKDHAQFGNGLLCFGGLHVYGEDKGECRIKLAEDASAGSVRITLARPAPSGWKVGDLIDLSDSRQLPLGWHTDGTYTGQTELATIADISPDRLTLTLVNPLRFSHRMRVNRRGRRFVPDVGHLSRNIVFRSENARGNRAHAIFFDHAEVDLHWCAFISMGRSTNEKPHSTIYKEIKNADGSTTVLNEPIEIGTNQQGRYPLHFHHLGGRPGGVRGVAEGVSVFCGLSAHPFKWPIVLHGTQDLHVRKCHTRNWAGSGIVMEDAESKRNVIEDCYVVEQRGVHGWNVTARPNTNEPFDMAGAGTQQLAGGIWYVNPNNTVRNNVVADVLDTVTSPPYQVAGYVIMGRATVSWIEAEQKFMNGVYEPVQEFSGNEAYSVPVALSIWEVGSDGFERSAIDESLIRDFTFWNCHEVGLYAYGLNNFLVDGFAGAADPSIASKPVGIGGWEYLLADCRFRNLDLDSMGTGFVQTVVTEGTITIEDSYLDCLDVNIDIPNLYPRVAPDPERAKAPRKTVIRNVRFGDQAPLNIRLDFAPTGTDEAPILGANLTGLDVIVVLGYDGDPDDNFRLYYRQQSPGYIVPASIERFSPYDPKPLPPGREYSQGRYGSPEPGLTNHQLWTKHGLAIAGAVLPANAVERERIEGLTAPLT